MSRSNRLVIWLVVNVCFVVLVILAAAQRGGDDRVLYVSALFALCSTPILCIDRLNGRYVLLAILAPFYFVLYGMLDLLGMLFGGYPPSIQTGAHAAEAGILCGMVCLLLGYFAGGRLANAPGSDDRAKDWPQSFILLVGLTIWILGSLSILYFQIYVVPEKTVEATRRGLASMGPLVTFVVLLGNLVAPLGMLILTYGYAKYRTRFWLGLVLGLMFAQLVIGFVTDIRGQALMPPLMVIVALTLVDNKLPKGWLLGSLVGLMVFFPILSAYRTAVTGDRGLSREAAVRNLSKVIDVVLAYKDTATESREQGFHSSLFERLSVKDNMDRLFSHTGEDVPFQQGRTLAAIPLAFVPRIVFPDKFDVPTGQVFNHAFFKNDDDTYISPSHLGELYWNFGWPGLVAGALVIGALLGFVAAKCSMAEHASLTRMLVLLATVQFLCLGFEGAMSVSYISWLRSLAVIGMLHLLFARAGSSRSQISQTPAPAPEPIALPRFPNMMR
jgi:hypothetical protein